MTHIFSDLLYHVTWHTAGYAPLLSRRAEHALYPFLRHRACQLDCAVLEVGGTANRVHLALRVPPSRPVSVIIDVLKSDAVLQLNRVERLTPPVQWQQGFIASTLAPPALDDLRKWIRAQSRTGAYPAGLHLPLEHPSVQP